MGRNRRMKMRKFCADLETESKEATLLANSRIPMSVLRYCALFFAMALFSIEAIAMDQVTINRGGFETNLEGEIVVEAQDGGLMFRATDGRIWMIQPDEIKSKSSNSKPFKGLDANKLLLVKKTRFS